MEGESSEMGGTASKGSVPELKILVWNIQGLLDEFLTERSKGVVGIVEGNKPAVIMLQEVIESTYSYFNEALSSNYIGYSP